MVLDFVTFRNWRLKFLIEFVVYISLWISDGYLKYVDNCGQLFRQDAIEAGCFLHKFSSSSSNAASVRSSVLALYTSFKSAINGFRYTQYIGKVQMEMKAELTFACMNLKKLAKILEIREAKTQRFLDFFSSSKKQSLFIEKWCREWFQHQLCLQSGVLYMVHNTYDI